MPIAVKSGSSSKEPKKQGEGLRISVGLCAWNEEHWITETLESLLKQDIFSSRDTAFQRVEVIVLANACTDHTADKARLVFQNAIGLATDNRIDLKVIESAEGGLAWAINKITHELSDPTADYLVKLDCDVTFDAPNVLSALVHALEQDAQAQASRPILKKHIAKKGRRSLVDRFSMFASGYKSENRWWVDLSGPCYCGRAKILREIWEPIGLRGTDVFVRDMIVTSNWRHPKDRQDERIILVPDVSAHFVTYSTIRSMLYHQTRHQMALVMRDVLHGFLDEAVGPAGAGELISQLNENNSNWFHELLHSRLRHNHWWVIPRQAFPWNRVRSLFRNNRGRVVTRLFPVFLMDLVESYCRIRANILFKKRREGHVWRLDR